MAARVELRESVEGDELLVAFVGDVDLYGIIDLKSRLNDIIDRNLEKIATVTLDMAGVGSIDSSGIAMLANIQKRVENHSRKFWLTNLSRSANRIMKLSALDQVLNIKD